MTLSALGIFSAAGAGGAVAGDYELISTTILASPQAAISFNVSSLGSTYRHLQLRTVTRVVNAGVGVTLIRTRFNSDTGTNYTLHRLWGNGSTVPSDGNANLDSGYSGYNFYAGEGGFSANVSDILDAFSTTKNKTLRVLGGGANSTRFIGLHSFVWRNTNAITSIVLEDQDSANFATGSRFSLYGIRG